MPIIVAWWCLGMNMLESQISGYCDHNRSNDQLLNQVLWRAWWSCRDWHICLQAWDEPCSFLRMECVFLWTSKHKLFTGGSDFCWPRCFHDISDHFQHISMSKDYQFYDRVVSPTCEFSTVQAATHAACFIRFTLIDIFQVMGRLRGSQQQILSIIRNHMEMEEWLGEPRGVIRNDSKIGLV